MATFVVEKWIGKCSFVCFYSNIFYDRCCKEKNGLLNVCVIILSVHFMMMFVSNSIDFDLPNVLYWIVAGMCLTNKNKYSINLGYD